MGPQGEMTEKEVDDRPPGVRRGAVTAIPKATAAARNRLSRA